MAASKKGGGATLRASPRPGEKHEDSIARIAVTPYIQAARTAQDYTDGFPDTDLTALAVQLKRQCDAASNGDLTRAEELLVSQAHTLDAIFHNLARRAANADLMSQCEAYLRLGLRAQSQCRATMEALSAVKNPRIVAYVAQANIAHGHQQVNNASPRAGKIESAQPELLENSDGERLDTAAADAAGRIDTPLETVGEGDRSENR